MKPIKAGMLVKDRTLTIVGRVERIDAHNPTGPIALLTLTRSHRSGSVYHGTPDGKGVHAYDDARIIGDRMWVHVRELLPIRWMPPIRRAAPYAEGAILKYGSNGSDLVIPAGCAPWTVDHGTWQDTYLTRREARKARARYMVPSVYEVEQPSVKVAS